MQEIVFIIEEAFVTPTSIFYVWDYLREGLQPTVVLNTDLWCLNSPWWGY